MYNLKDVLPEVKKYYISAGCPSINLGMHKARVEEVRDNINKLNMKPSEYISIVTQSTNEEIIRKQILYPKILASNYALLKIDDTLSGKDVKSSIPFIKRSKKRFSNEYFSTAKTVPGFLIDIANWDISLLACVMDNRFQNAIKNIGADVYEEFLGDYDLSSIRSTIYLNDKLYKACI